MKALQRTGRDQTVLAWKIAALVGMSKVKPLADVLKAWEPRPAGPRRKMTAEQIESVFDGMAARKH